MNATNTVYEHPYVKPLSDFDDNTLYATHQVIALAVATVYETGWVSQPQARREHRTSTADRVLAELTQRATFDVTDTHMRVASEIITWAKRSLLASDLISPDTHDVCYRASELTVHLHDIPRLTEVVREHSIYEAAYARASLRLSAAASARKQCIASVGNRLTIPNLTIVNAEPLPSAPDTDRMYWKYTLLTEAGHHIVWTTNQQLRIGTVMDAKCTIMEHIAPPSPRSRRPYITRITRVSVVATH